MTVTDRFEHVVAERVSQGWRVESRTPLIAVLARGKRPNHILHLLLSLVTFGLWVLVWINVAAWGGVRRSTIRVDGDRLIEETQRAGALKSWPPIKRELA